MIFHIVSIFPNIFDSFFQTSLIAKAINKGLINCIVYNPRNFVKNKHKQIDDEIYGGGYGMLIIAQPMIDCVNNIIDKNILNKEKTSKKDFLIINLTPSKLIFNQELAYKYSKKYKHIIIICGRYEGIDYRFNLYFQKKYPDNFVNLSLGQFIVMGGESPAMIVIEAISRLIKGVIKEESWKKESYQISKNCNNIEHPQYTRPQIVEGLKVPDILLSGHDANIEKWKQENSL